MATKTRAELVQAALEEIKVLAAGQSPSSEDSDKVERALEPMLAELAAREIVYIADSDEIPNAVFGPLTRRLGAEIAGAFGATGPSIEDEEWRLSRITAGRPTYEPLQDPDGYYGGDAADYS
ncbi:MAG: hypothetical protein WC058_16360 [Phycisphaeraceae bacterium]